MPLDISKLTENERLAHAEAYARMMAAKHGIVPRRNWKEANPQLWTALQTCVESRKLIESEQEKFLSLISRSENVIEQEAREYQRDLIAWQLNRAADIAERRIAYLDKLRDFKAENEKCAKDMDHWFDYYAWGYDPRPDSPLQVMPLDPFEFQDRYLHWLNSIVFDSRSSGVVEKSRDMGATIGALAWCTYHWKYTEGFSAMVSSATEELIDSKKDPDTLFEKVRFNIKMFPNWMLPKDFNLERDMPFMNIANPDNRAVITGAAPTARVGRQRRRTVVFADEFQTWPFGGYQQHTALSMVAKSLIALGTPEGRFNKYADLTHDGVTSKFEMDWREHEWKDQRWYNALPFGYLGPAMTVETVAQEIDRNYEASQPGRVITNCKEEYCFITWSEFIAGYEAKGRRLREGKVPDGWNWGRVSDYGMSAKTENDTHIWAYNIFARPSEGWAFKDSLFFFCALPIEPIGATELQAFDFYSNIEREFGLRGGTNLIRRPVVNDMSHEATDPKEVLLKQCGDNWNIPDLDFFKGVSKLRFHFEITDKHLPNPFRPSLPGRSRVYFIAPDQEYQLARNERSEEYFVTPSKTQRGYRRLRAEIQSWHFPPEERGKPVQKMRPKPVFDDIITTVRYALARWGVQSAPLTPTETLEARLVPELRIEAIRDETHPAIQQAKIQSRQLYLMRMEAERNRAAQAGVSVPRVRFTR